MRTLDRRHLFHFIFLLLLLSLVSLLILAFQFQTTFQIILIIFLGLTYILWGIIHHFKIKDLHPRIILEYVLIALLGTAVLITILIL